MNTEARRHRVFYLILNKILPLCLSVSVLVLLIRYFLIGSYQISTYSMEDALHKGDYILVNKMPLGITLERNDVALFTSPLRKDRDAKPLMISRCIALPGDTIQVSDKGYRVNGVLYPRSPYSLQTYVIDREIKDSFLEVLVKMDIPLRDVKEGAEVITLSLTPFEEYSIRGELAGWMNPRFRAEEARNYTLVVPRHGQSYRLTDAFLTAGREAILSEAPAASFHDKKLMMNGKEITIFRFTKDYYWVLSDNMNDGIDSRHLGFIPADHIVGKAWFCWYSKDKQRRFKKID